MMSLGFTSVRQVVQISLKIESEFPSSNCNFGSRNVLMNMHERLFHGQLGRGSSFQSIGY